MKKQPRLIVISAPSGAGKTTLCDMLLKENSNIVRSISSTTRKKRPEEVEGKDYFFLSDEEFKKKIRENAFIEYAEVHGRFYGTPRTFVENWLTKGKHVAFNIDVQGAMEIQKQYPDQVLLIFIEPPSLEILEERLRKRQSDNIQDIENRLKNAYNELQWSPKFHYQITNDKLEQAYRQLKEIVHKECP